nr:TnsA endonuclease N-terminal domain-containing protein [Pseudovibrio sp. WM33]
MKRWDGCRPPQTASQCTRITVVFNSKRTHHLQFDLELSVFLLLKWHSEVIQVREPFPLEIDDTRKLALEAGIKHPDLAGVDQYMSSDFLASTARHML